MRKSNDHLTVVRTEPRGFYELAKAHVAAHGGEFVVDRKSPEQAHQRRAWLAYFAWLDDQTTPSGHKATTFRRLEKFTVPAEWPIEFDASAPPAPLPEPREEMPSPQRRRELAEMLRQVVAGFAMPVAPRAKPFTLPVGEGKALFADRAQVNTADFANYLGDMRAKETPTSPDVS